MPQSDAPERSPEAATPSLWSSIETPSPTPATPLPGTPAPAQPSASPTISRSAAIAETLRSAVPPVGATAAVAVFDHLTGAYRAAWLIDGRRKSAPFGPAFSRPRDAAELVRQINGEEPAP